MNHTLLFCTCTLLRLIPAVHNLQLHKMALKLLVDTLWGANHRSEHAVLKSLNRLDASSHASIQPAYLKSSGEVWIIRLRRTSYLHLRPVKRLWTTRQKG